MLNFRTSALATLCALGLVSCICSGCRSDDKSATWGTKHFFRQVRVPFPGRIGRRESLHQRLATAASQLPADQGLDEAVENVRLAEQAEHDSDPQCVSLYAQAVMASWQMLQTSDNNDNTTDEKSEVAWEIYHGGLSQLAAAALEHGRLDPQTGISWVTEDGEEQLIQIAHHGFPWKAENLSALRIVPGHDDTKLKRYWEQPGLGVPLLVQREHTKPQPYMSQSNLYSATAILRPADNATTDNAITDVVPNQVDRDPRKPRVVGVLDLHDPVRVAQVSYNHRTWDLARDVSAPLAVAREQFNRDNYKSFLLPGREADSVGLRMIEPYQPGKIPIVFVHGLLSDRVTWIDLLNDLRAVPWFGQHYQVWAFQYPTGQPYIRSAAEMRQALTDAVEYCDPQGADTALSQMVLVGHSMGGLVSKLQVSDSGNALWDAIATRPADEITVSDEERAVIDSIFFFEPLPFVERVVFIGSPHQGSPFAKSWAGTIGSKLVVRPKERIALLKSVVNENPGIFKGDLSKHLPASVDLLRSDNAILMAAYQLPVNPNVQLHTIIGTGKSLKDGTPADGVVPVTSARHPGTISERLIDTTHTQLTDHPETTEEVLRILMQARE